MGVTAALDNLSKPAWAGLLVLSFILFWPVGAALLAYLIWSRRMNCWKHRAPRWHEQQRNAGMSGWYRGHYRSSGNAAFDEYRDETLRRLEEEQKEFRDFLERLRHAKDKFEFDQFMAERRRQQPPSPPSDQTPPEPQQA
ncbi:DUF2852 domain-containing protein [Reyranella sp. CPCC 100927]|uniref:DUF2852 domain-containing protein n=1 Tax=Reyranella sp. CPCC 100927 TaxID=2599616 RepID=UPI0011B5899D|nr:DUF2852 domain-containing protein [Reyranella sp. CPCC 100927]TWT00285.1 DUF2852 domain-containing protein [Reyranella sp. CPCC 100927]